jgi:hypothetical protein
LLLALGRITDDIKRNDSGSPRDVDISPSDTQGQTDLPILIDELPKQTTPMTRKKPNRKKKKDCTISWPVNGLLGASNWKMRVVCEKQPQKEK